MPRDLFTKFTDAAFDDDGDLELQHSIATALDLPSVQAARETRVYLVLDIAITHYRRIQVFRFLDAYAVFARPSIQLKARLVHIPGQRVVATAKITKHQSWGAYLAEALTFRGFFGLGYARGYDQLQLEALVEALGQLRRRLA